MSVFLLMSDDRVDCHCHDDSFLGCGCVFKGGRTGTVYGAYESLSAANDALAEVERGKAAQRQAMDAWVKRSWDENPVIPEAARDLMAPVRSLCDRNKRRNDWIEKHPFPPSDLQRNFWVVEVAT